MRYTLILLLLSAAMLRTAAQENYTLADTLTLDAVVVTGVTLTSMTDEGNLRFNVSKIEGNTGADITNILDRLPGVTASQKQGLTLNGQSAVLYIDGRTQKLSGSQAVSLLKTMPVESIESIELNSYTGSGYQASTGAVINIVTTKMVLASWQRMWTLGAMVTLSPMVMSQQWLGSRMTPFSRLKFTPTCMPMEMSLSVVYSPRKR